MNTSPTISVLLPVYNGEKYIRSAVDSILKQSFSDFELIVIDDGSTDDTQSILAEYTDSRLRILFKKNTGLTESLNFGLDHAEGIWIARLDSDDISRSDRLEKQLKFVESDSSIVLVGSNARFIDHVDNLIFTYQYPFYDFKLRENLKIKRAFFPHSSVLISKSALLEVGGYNSWFKRAQDYDLWLRLAAVGRLACIQEYLTDIRRHSAQISNDESGRMQLNFALVALSENMLHSEFDLSEFDFNDSHRDHLLELVVKELSISNYFDRLKAVEKISKIKAGNFLYIFGFGFRYYYFSFMELFDRVFGRSEARRVAKRCSKAFAAEYLSQ